MANNYLQFSKMLLFHSQEEKLWWEEQLTERTFLAVAGQRLVKEEPDAGFELCRLLAAHYEREDGEEYDNWISRANVEYGLDFQWVIENEGDHGAVWIFAEEYGDPDHVCWVVHQFMKHFGREEPWWFTWAATCSKLRLDEFDGGGAVVTKDVIKAINTAHWCSNTIEEMAK